MHVDTYRDDSEQSKQESYEKTGNNVMSLNQGDLGPTGLSGPISEEVFARTSRRQLADAEYLRHESIVDGTEESRFGRSPSLDSSIRIILGRSVHLLLDRIVPRVTDQSKR